MPGRRRSVPGVDTDSGEDVPGPLERCLAAGTWRHTLVLPHSDEGPGAQLYYSLPCSLSKPELDQLPHRKLGAGLEAFRRLTQAGLISGECHRLVADQPVRLNLRAGAVGQEGTADDRA
jgi:hypothetical protein